MAFKICSRLLSSAKKSSTFQAFDLNEYLIYKNHCFSYPSRKLFTSAHRTLKSENDGLIKNNKSTVNGTQISDSKSKDKISQHSNSPVQGKKLSSALGTIQKALGSVSSSYSTYGASEIIFKECSRHAAYKMISTGEEIDKKYTDDGQELGVPEGEALWHSEFCLPATFSTWSQVTMLYMYLLVVRIRNSTASQVRIWQQNLQDQFFFAAEDRMNINHNMTSGSVRAKYLKDLFVQWRGLLAAYDEGLVRGDAPLAAAVWRNIFQAREDVDIRHLAQIVSYMRHILQVLDSVSTLPDLINFRFPQITVEKSTLLLPSQMMKQPFDKSNASKAVFPDLDKS